MCLCTYPSILMGVSWKGLTAHVFVHIPQYFNGDITKVSHSASSSSSTGKQHTWWAANTNRVAVWVQPLNVPYWILSLQCTPALHFGSSNFSQSNVRRFMSNGKHRISRIKRLRRIFRTNAPFYVFQMYVMCFKHHPFDPNICHLYYVSSIRK